MLQECIKVILAAAQREHFTTGYCSEQHDIRQAFFVCILCKQNQMHAYFIFALVTTTQRALHGVAALHSYLSPHNNAGGRLFGALHNKTTAGHAEGWGDLGQDLRKSLKTHKNVWDVGVFLCRCVCISASGVR